MKILSFISVLFIFNFFSAQAQNAVETDGAKIEFVESEHDFGQLEEGPKAKYSFKFTNTGNKPLIISNVKASCGCTTPYWPKEPIMPGASETITAEYNTQGRPGPFNKAITITTNTQPETKMVFIKGTVSKAPENDGVPVKPKSILME